jgi:hypothetical protein
MTTELKESHPGLMVPIVYTMGVVIYTNGGRLNLPTEQIREAIIAALPPGTGVGQVTCTYHGVYSGPQGALK